MIAGIFNRTPQVALEFALDVTSTSAHLIAHNIANADTPNYKAQRLDFQDHLERAVRLDDFGVGLEMKRTDPRHIDRIAPRGIRGINTPYGLIYTDEKTVYRLDGNNVDIDHEMAEQAKNSLQYAVLTELINRRLQGLRTAIAGGR